MNILKLIPWKGGACPVNPKDEVLVMFSGRSYESDVAARYNWGHGAYDHPGNIMYYAVTRQAEPDLEPIIMGEKYETRDGRPVEIYRTDGGGRFPVHFGAQDADGTWAIGFTDSVGRTEGETPYLVKVKLPFEDFKLDEPVMVRNTDADPWLCRHFAGVKGGVFPRVWADGKTSWTRGALPEPVPYNHCRRPTPEELERFSV